MNPLLAPSPLPYGFPDFAAIRVPAALPQRLLQPRLRRRVLGGLLRLHWSEVLADTVDWFTEHGGLRRENGDAFARALHSRGGAVDPMAAYRAFRGRDPQIGPLLARRGLLSVSGVGTVNRGSRSR